MYAHPQPKSPKFRLITLTSAVALTVIWLVGCGGAPQNSGSGSFPTSSGELGGMTAAPAATQPVEATEASIPTQPLPTQPLPTSQPAVQEARRLNLEWPFKIRLGDSDVIKLTLEIDNRGNMTPTAEYAGHQTRGETVFVPNVYDTHNVLAEARLDMAGIAASPSGDVIEPLQPGEPVTFFWSVSPEKIGTYRGTVWLHLHFIPKEPGGIESRIPISAEQIQIQAVNLMGIGGTAARVIGALGVVLGSFLSLDKILAWGAGLLRKLTAGKPDD